MKRDRSGAQAPAPLTATSAFVVHLAATSSDAPDSVRGRVEHVTSGHAQRFATVAELIGFMRSTLNDSNRQLQEHR